jgi:predicted lipoprotein with Yx(FWY)xxD motif
MRIVRSAVVALVVAASAAASAAAVTGAAVVETHASPIGKVVADAHGRTLYLFRADHGRTSVCYGACATYWPPLLTKGEPRAAAGVKASLLGTTKRRDGKLQVTYKGHPLYLFVKDTRPGTAAGEGVNGFGGKWYALAPSGATIDRD